jgi:hypothetical protein
MLFHFCRSLIKIYLLENITLYLYSRYLPHVESVFSVIYNIFVAFVIVKF